MTSQHRSLGINTKGKAYKRYLKANLLTNVDKEYTQEIRNYWYEKINKKIDPALPIAFANLTGENDSRVIPPLVMWNDFIPYFNDRGMMNVYSEKNIYDVLVDLPNSVEIVIKRIRGYYYDSNNNLIDITTVGNILLNTEQEYIIKPSDTDNGIGIEKINVKNGKLYIGAENISLPIIEKKYQNNFSIQKVIKQHEIMAQPHPESVNTLRMVTLRFKGEIHYLLTFARFGANNSVNDNAGTGGVCLGVNDDGSFLEEAIDANANSYAHHPSTGFPFKNMGKIENFDEFINYVIEGHKKILHHDFVSWDIAVDEKGQPVFIEANFRGATWLYQLASRRPIFGDLTEEVVNYYSQEMKTKNKRDLKVRNPLRKENRRLTKSLQRSRKETEELKKKISMLENEIERLKNTKFRRLKSLLKGRN